MGAINMKISTGFWRKQLLGLISLVIFPGVCFPGSNPSYISVSNAPVLFLSEIWVGGGLQYFPYTPFSVLPIPAYPEVQWWYPCFPFASCLVQQQYRKHKFRGKRQQPRPIFGHGSSLADESMEAWRAGLRPTAEPFRTDEQLIVPAFRGHGLIKPEYQKAGSFRPEFAPDKK